MTTKIPQYRITCEGITKSLKMIDIDTGERLKNITKLRIVADPQDCVRVEVHFIGVEIDLSAWRPMVAKRPVSFLIWRLQKWWAALCGRDPFGDVMGQ